MYDGPKKPRNAYLFYQEAKRAEVAAANPELERPAVSTMLAAAFKALPAEERKPYEDAAEADKERYVR